MAISPWFSAPDRKPLWFMLKGKPKVDDYYSRLLYGPKIRKWRGSKYSEVSVYRVDIDNGRVRLLQGETYFLHDFKKNTRRVREEELGLLYLASY